MHDFLGWIASIKMTTLAASFGGAALAVLIEFKRHTWATAFIALISGVFVGAVATEPLLSALGWPPATAGGIGAVLGISGRNLIVWVLAVSKDPIAAWKNRK